MVRRAVASACPVLLLACLVTGVSAGAAAGGPLPRLGVSFPLGTPASVVVRTMTAAGIGNGLIIPPPLVVRVGGIFDPRGAMEYPPEGGAGLDLYVHLVVQIDDVPGTGREREALIEERVSQILGFAALDTLKWKGVVIEVAPGSSSQEVLQFSVAQLIIKARGMRPGLQVALMLPDDALERFEEVSRRLVAYADSIVVRGGADGGPPARKLVQLAAGRPIILRAPTPATVDPGEAGRAFVELLFSAGSTQPDILWLDVATQPGLQNLCRSYRFLEQSLGSGFQVTSVERVPAAVLVDGQPAASALGFVGTSSADAAFLLKAGGSRGQPRVLSVAGAGESLKVVCYDAMDGRRLAAPREAKSGAACAADAEYVFTTLGRGGGEKRLFEAVDVRGRAGLTVEEIIARWQAAREAERGALGNYSVPCLLTLHFESTSIGASFDVSLDLQRFVDRSGVDDWVQTGLFVNGVRFRTGQEFPLPLLEPEKVMTQPLELALDEKYVYRLLGTDTVNGVLSYVVEIEPAGATALLYAGRVWIDGVTFRQVRMRLEQRTGQHNISTHLETQDFRTVRDAEGREFTVFQRIFVEEAINVAGRPATLEKTYRFGDYAVNAADFAARLDAARASENPMFRDTPEGLRSLRRRDGVRVVEPAPGKRIESWLFGTVYDGSYSFPVPLFGVSVVDFDFRGKGEQLSGIFAGLLLAGNLSKQRGPTLRTSVECALSALSTLNRVYIDDVAQTGSEFRTFEQSAGALVSWQASPAWTLTASSHVVIQSFRRTNGTSPTFITPSTALILRAWGEIKYALKTLDASVLVEPAFRLTGLGEYGWVGEQQTPGRTVLKYQAEVNKHVYVGKLTRGGVTASYYGGVALDRLSLYNTSFLTKPRIAGVPAGVESFDAIGIAGAYYGFNVMDLAKLTGTYNHAWARNIFESSQFRQFDGITVDLGLAGPWATFVQGTVGYTLAGSLGRYNQRWGAMMLVYKPIRR